MGNFSNIDKYKDAVSIDSFIINYLNDGVYVECNDLTHKQFKSFNNPYVVTVPNDYADANLDLVYSGKIILVRDVFGNLAPYINPLDLKLIDHVKQVKDEIDKLQNENGEMNELSDKWNKLQELLQQMEQIDEVEDLLLDIKDYKKEVGRRR